MTTAPVTVSAAIMAYQAEKKITDLLESLVGKVDQIVVGIDSKSTDHTQEVAEAFGAETFSFDLDDNFAGAREQTFSRCTSDWILWIDTDDVLAQDVPIHQLLDEQAADVGMVWLPYVYHRDEYGNATTIFDRERLIRRSMFSKWTGRLHETCQATGKMTRDDRVWVEHKNRTEEGKGDRNFRILAKMVEGDPNDHRAVLYMAHQFFAAQDWFSACQWYERFIGLSSPGDVLEEKWQAVIYLTKARRSVGDLDGSLRSGKEALLMCPQYADAYFELSHTYACMGDWGRSIHWHEEGLTRKQPDRILIQNPLDYSFNPFVVIHRAYFESGKLDKALNAAEKAQQQRPNDQSLINAVVQYRWQAERTEAVESALRIAQHLLMTNEPLKAQTILDALPAGVESPRINEAKAAIASRVAHLNDEVEYENFYFYFESEETSDVAALLEHNANFPRVDWTIERLKKMGAKRILEVGIGDGLPSFRYARAGFEVVGIDIDPRRVQRANKDAIKLGFLSESYKPEHRATTPDMEGAQVQFRYGSAESIPPEVRALGPFDAVILAEILEHVPDMDKVLDEAETVSKHIFLTTPDGASSYQFFENTVNPDHNHSGHVRALSLRELETIAFKRGRVVESHLCPSTDYILLCEYVAGESILERPPVVIYCGPGLEEWTPEQIDRQGLGGSETAAVKLAEELVSRGLRVMVYGPSEGIWGGVFYRHYSKYNPTSPVFLTISWRNPALFDLPINSHLKYLWMHDTDAGPNLTEERAAKVDAVMALSDWHISHLVEMYPFLDGKCFIVGNGIDADRFTETVDRNVHKFVYTSSPDRGLEQALNYWPKIREQLPDAEFHVMYGWENFDKMGGPRDYQRHIMGLASQPGVVWRGRMGQKELARELMQASVMFYPGPHTFDETFCIAALEAQAAGCVPVTRDNGALPETNSRGVLVPNDAQESEWVDAAVKATGTHDKRRAFLADWAKTQSWAAACDRLLLKVREMSKAA